MSYRNEFYLVRHGKYGDDWNLDATGREIHAPSARDQLLARGLGSGAVLLSSDAPRAAQTAEIIGRGLGVQPVLSRLINEAGNEAWGVQDLDEVVEGALRAADITLDESSQELVVVTHAPMVAIAKGVPMKEITFGEVFAYQRHSWNNPEAPKQP